MGPDGYLSCVSESGCDPLDAQCALEACGSVCERDLGGVSGVSPRASRPPCEGAKTPVDENILGTWELVAEAYSSDADFVPSPRPDHARRLSFTPEGCFTVELDLRQPTLGPGNSLDVRLHGVAESLPPSPERKTRRVRLTTQRGELVGTLCGRPVRVPIERGLTERVFEVERPDGLLILDRLSRSERVLQFERVR